MDYYLESQLRQVILYFVEAAAGRSVSLPRIKLVKLLYLVDLASQETTGKTATGLNWVFHHYGPWAPELEEVLERAEGIYFHRVDWAPEQRSRLQEANARFGGRSADDPEVIYLYTPIGGLPDEPIQDQGLARIAASVAHRWVSVDTAVLLEHVYATPPVARGVRYTPIDWALVPRLSGLFSARAAAFAIDPEAFGSLEAAWARWSETGTDVWTDYTPEPSLFDDNWSSALERMDADEGQSAVDVRITGQLPRGRSSDQ